MAYIYKITNKINGKIYVGKTLKTPQQRWSEHVRDSYKDSCKDRPLYRAFKKYGLENFTLDIIEQCPVDKVNERERFWIESLQTFKYGYNATLGGDGKHYCDYDLIYSLFQQGKNIKEITQITGYDGTTCRKALDNFNVSSETRHKRGNEARSKTVIQLNKDTNEILAIFPSLREAYESIGKPQSGHIAAVCQGKRKTAYGYKWMYG